jgi:hypothetical protein
MAARRAAFAAACVAAVVIAGCNGLGPPAGPVETDGHLADAPRNVPTHLDNGSSPLSQIGGTLTVEGKCVYLIGGSDRYLPIWPSDYWLDGTTLMSGHRKVATAGDRMTLIGGTYELGDINERLTNLVLPECAMTYVFWAAGVVGHVATPGPSPRSSAPGQ